MLHACALAGGVATLARKVGLASDTLAAMARGGEPIPTWVFLRVVDYINEVEHFPQHSQPVPPDWLKGPDTKQ